MTSFTPPVVRSLARCAVLSLALFVVGCGGSTDTQDAESAGAASDSSGAPTPQESSAPVTAPVETTVPETVVVETSMPAATTAHIRGTAYTFNTPDPISGATIRVEELPDVSAVTGADGSYELEVPYGSRVTAYIEAEGHHSIHVQTFVLDAEHDGAELDGVNFQTPSAPIYDGLRALMAGITGRDPFEDGCAIVTTVGDARMVGMPFAEFIEFHPHGVEGAVARLEPEVVAPIYFNDDVLPDPAQATSSIDGGVIWVNVPPGEYTLHAEKAGTEFVEVLVRCEQDWVVNANPVWGLHAIP